MAVASAAIILLVPLLASAGPGDPDRSFGGDGVAQLSSDTVLRGAAVQRDGKLIAVGEQGAEAGNARLLAVRFNRNGSLDRSFNPSGPGLPILGGGDGGAYAGARGTTAHDVTIQPNGRIVVAGGRTDPSGTTLRGMLVTRLRANGTLDRSFSGDGVATALVGRQGRAYAVALHGRRIVAAGSATLGSKSDGFARAAVAGFRSSGSRDRRFGADGARILDFGRLSMANAVAVRRDGRILLAGSQRADLQTTRVLAARLTARGRRDRGFSRDGLFLRQYARGAAFSAANDLFASRGGKVVIGGVATSATRGSTAFALRLGSGGSPDRGFSGDGIAYLAAARDRDQFTKIGRLPGAYGIARAGGRIVLAGYYDNLGLRRLALWALKGNGRTARGFGRNGRTITPMGRNAQLSDVAGGRGKLYGVGDVTSIVDPPTGLAAGFDG